MNIIFDYDSLVNLKKWFASYVASFKLEDPDTLKNIQLKEIHTSRVCTEIVNIGQQLGLKDDALNVAEAIALLHDVGRFEQYTVYKTFKDQKSVNHAELGVEILEKYDVLKHIDNTTKNIITRSVKYHNRVALPDNETELCLFYAKLIRDADKLDIWKIVTEYYTSNTSKNKAIELDFPDTPSFSKEVYADLTNKRIVDMKNVSNLNDFKLLQVGWVFDINFQPTLHFIKKRKYIEIMREVLPKSKEIDSVFDIVNLSLVN